VRFGVATDLGHVPAPLAPFLGACDAALLEANYVRPARTPFSTGRAA
jgi:hypothetical protein